MADTPACLTSMGANRLELAPYYPTTRPCPQLEDFDADERIIEPLLAAGKKFIIPPKSNRNVQRLYDKELYKARHLMENFYCKLKQYRAIATRYDKTARNFLAGIQAAAVIWLN